ncbi:MAG: type II toxin-antitoxin system RelE/ParE family toxin [Verrucomicrobiae bacterium]|nr:type II toxin-antitoxin system RelE/ParE family toxin [Verrucomicrobiae bacterium]MCP5522116.1 type II toxin-antitoxin system RelE/ParE family toxin [Verrucomicrobiales bacterium]
MKSVVLLAEAVEDIEQARSFYDRQEKGVGDYCVTSLLADISKLGSLDAVHRRQHGCHRLLAGRFPFGIYYLDGTHEIRVVAVLDLRRDPGWIRRRVSARRG